MSPASSADVLICRRSTARIVPSWTGISYCLAVRLSTTVRVSLGTPGILGIGWRKITRALSWRSHDSCRVSQTGQSLPDPLGSGSGRDWPVWETRHESWLRQDKALVIFRQPIPRMPGVPKDTLTVVDNRTAKQYEIPVQDGTIRAVDLRQIKTSAEDAGLMT